MGFIQDLVDIAKLAKKLLLLLEQADNQGDLTELVGGDLLFELRQSLKKIDFLEE